MAHVVQQPTVPFRIASGALEVHQVPDATDNLVWLLVNPASGEAAAVDGPGAAAALRWCEERELKLSTVLNTHTHPDHIGINRQLQLQGRLPEMRVVGPAPVADDIPGITEPVDDGDSIRFGGVQGRVMRTEGHLDGHISYVFEDVLFCGDTLFTGGCGYLFDGPPEAMFRSLLRLAALDGDTRVCCAHEYTQDNLRFAWQAEPGNEALAARIRDVWDLRAQGGCAVPSRMETERATNPFLRPGSPTLVARVRQRFPERDLSTPVGVFAATRAWKDLGEHKSAGDEPLPLLDPEPAG